MATITTLDKSTYQQVIDDILFDITDSQDQVKSVPPEQYMRWILEAEQDICQRLTVRDRKWLRLIAGTEDYLFRDSRNISGTGTITSVGVAVVGTGTLFNTEIVPFTQITVGTETHTVASITDDTHLTLVDAFTADISVAAAFTFAPSAIEIPTETFAITAIDRIEESYHREIKVRPLSWLLALRVEDRIGKVYINLDTPYVAAPYSVGEVRYLKVYPVSDSDKNVELFTVVKVNPRIHTTDTLASNISLTNEYEPMIRFWVERMIARRSHNAQDEVKYNAYYENAIHMFKLNIDNDTRITFEYR